jgi:hypothetical protein
MDERRHHIFVDLALFMVIKKHMVVTLLAFQKIVRYEQNVEMMLMVVFILERGRMNTSWSSWKYKRVGGYVEQKFFS